MYSTTGGIAALGVAALGLGAVALPAQAQKRGGTLNFVVGSKIPSYDGHAEGTFGMIHPIRPFYSLLIRVNPNNPGDPTDFVCDLCEGSVPKPTDGGKTYTFRLKKGVTFHDGTPLTSADIVVTFNKIIKPPAGIRSDREKDADVCPATRGAGPQHETDAGLAGVLLTLDVYHFVLVNLF